MLELPEVLTLSKQANDVLSGKKPYVSNLINLDKQNEQN